jgi:hypothetical protein
MFRKLTLAGALIVGLVMALAAPAQAQRSFAPRSFSDQQTHYWRFTFNFNSCVIPPTGTTCSVKVASVPYNAFLTVIHKQIITPFNPTTSATISLNTTGAGANVMAAFNVFTGAALTAVTDTAFAGAGELVTGAGATPTATLGSGFDIYALYTTGAAGSQGTQGQAIFVLEYIAPNDGTCAPVPIGATAPAC